MKTEQIENKTESKRKNTKQEKTRQEEKKKKILKVLSMN